MHQRCDPGRHAETTTGTRAQEPRTLEVRSFRDIPLAGYEAWLTVSRSILLAGLRTQSPLWLSRRCRDSRNPRDS